MAAIIPPRRGMSGVHCFTSASYAYLDRARVLVETLRRHHAEWVLWLCLSDVAPEGFDGPAATAGFDHVVEIGELGIPDLKPWIFEHDVVELCTAVKGQMLCRLLDEGADKVVYLDPDIAVFSRLDAIVEALDRHDVILTPHQLQPDTERHAIIDNEIASLKYGIYNLGFVAVANRPEGRRFAAWWRDRLRHFCFSDIPAGLFTDQRWCDLAPAFFPTLHVLRDPGCNVASWNLSQRPIEIAGDGRITAGGSELRFFHFTKVTWIGEIMLERYANDRIEVFELMKWYRDRLAAHAVAGLPAGWWAFAHYEDGTPIRPAHRIAYRNDAALRALATDPFAAGAGIFATPPA